MKKKILALALSLAMAVTMLPATSVRAESSGPADASREVVTNDVGLDATVSESAISTWEMPNRINTDWEPQTSTNAGGTGWGNYGCQPDADGHWVRYDWADSVTTSSMQIYWYADGGGLLVPADLKIQYIDVADLGKDNVTWKDANMTTDYSTVKELDKYNVINFDEIKAVSIRLLMTRQGAAWMGIHRWKVMGNHQTLTAEQITSLDKLRLTLPSVVRGDFQLPAQTVSGKAISWESANTDAITVEGTTAKIGDVSGDVDVTMTAKVDGTVLKTFTVKVSLPINLREAQINLSNSGVYEYNGTAISPYIESVTYGDKILIYGTDWYPIMPEGAVNAGTYEIGITSEGTTGGEYTGSKMQPFTVAPKALLNDNVTLEKEEYNYTDGTAIEPAVTVKVTLVQGENRVETTLVKDTDYTVSYSGNTEPGTGIVTVEGKGNYKGTIKKNFSIVEAGKTNIKDAVVTLEKDAYLETGAAVEPSVTSVVLGDTTLTKDTDYTVSYLNNTEPGTATVVITGKGTYTGGVTKTFIILKDLNKAEIVLSNNGIYEYTGEAISPNITQVLYANQVVKWNDEWLPIMPSGAINPGIYQIGITAEGVQNQENTYGGSKTIDFKVVKTLADADVTLAQTDYTYEGTAIEPQVTVKVTIKNEEGTEDVEKTLVKDTDYTVEYKDNNAEGTGTATVKGIGVYAGTVEKTFNIAPGSGSNKPDMSTLTVTFPNEGKFEYTGAEIQPMVTVKDGETALSYGTDFTVDYPADMTAVGEKTVTVKPGSNGKYKGSKTASYEIKARTLTNDNTAITLTMPENIVAGTQVKPEVSVKVTVSNYAYEWYEEGTPTISHDLVKDTDYTVEYGENNTTGAEAGSVTITGKGNYTGSVEKKFAIGTEQPGPGTKTDLKDAVVTIPDCTYNKKAQTPAVTVKAGDKTLVKDTDYTVAYENNINAGTAKAVITAKEGSDYTGKTEKTFTIKKANATISAKNITKTIGAKNFGFGASVNSGAALSYKSSNTKVIKVVKGKAQIVKAGTSKITITAAATANYNAATKTIKIKVNSLKQVKISKVENKKSKQIKVTWKKDSNAAGYKVMYSTDKKFKNKKVTKTITIKKNKTTSCTIKKLKKGKKYYVKVCSYVKVGKKQVLGKYSKVKNIKIKK